MDIPYQQYFDSMPCYLSIQDRDLRIIEANRRFRMDFGEIEGRYCYQAYKHRSERCEVCPVERTFRDGVSHHSEEIVRTLEGEEVAVIVYTTPIRDENGEVTSVMEMSTDITEIKQLHKLLRESIRRYRLLFEEVPCYISIQDRDLKIVEANRQFRDDFGPYLGCHCYKIYKHREQECLPCPVQETFEDGQVHTSEEVVTSKKGEQINTLVYSAPIRGDDGQTKYVMEMSANITPVRRLQSQLESMGIVISSISHGIKGLLTGLDGGRYLVNSGLKKDKPERVTEGWQMVERNVERIRSMVMNILYYAKHREPNWEALSAPVVADEACKLMEGKAKEHGVTLRRAPDQGAGDFQADAQAMRALLINLLENSVDACSADKKKTDHEVSIRVDGDGDHVRFEVLDNGIGMDQETREKAFSPFFSSKGMAGTGLGLFICGNIAKAHGGSIEVESEVDRGTRFTLELPRRAIEEERADEKGVGRDSSQEDGSGR